MKGRRKALTPVGVPKVAEVISLAEWRRDNPTPEDVARLLRAVDEGSPAHALPDFGMMTLRRATTRLANLACAPVEETLADTFEQAVAAMPGQAEREAGLLTATLWRCLHGRALPKPGGPQKETHKRVLSSNVYVEASTFADIFCDATARRDVTREIRELIGRAFKELGALVGVPDPARAWTWKKARAAFIEMQREVRLLCEAEGLKDTPHNSDLHKLDPYTHTGKVTSIAVWLGALVYTYWCADEYGTTAEKCTRGSGGVSISYLAERVAGLRRALEWSARIERYGVEAVRRAEDCRARLLSDAVAAARASVPDVGTLLNEIGAPDVDAAMLAELRDDWRKFTAEEGGDDA